MRSPPRGQRQHQRLERLGRSDGTALDLQAAERLLEASSPVTVGR